MNTAKPKPTVDDILASLQKGERLGIDEALMLLAASKKMLDRSGMEQFFDAARAAARTRQLWQRLDVEVIDLNKTPLSELESLAQESDADKVFLQFPREIPADTLFATIERVAKHVPVGAFTPKEILDRSAAFSMKVSEFCRRLAQAGLSFSSGRFDAREFGTTRIDEVFSVMMQVAKAKMTVSAFLPMSFSEEEKALHLAKLREFHDRTQALSFVVLHLDAKFSDRDLLRTVALTRLMLDNIETISLADYDLFQEKKLDADLLRQCIEVGLNQS
jgi:2-iminoacetate synthase ThiH